VKNLDKIRSTRITDESFYLDDEDWYRQKVTEQKGEKNECIKYTYLPKSTSEDED